MNTVKIPEEILDKYHIVKSDSDGSTYHTFLLITDYKIVKLYEQITMEPEKSEALKEEFIKNNSELVYWRQVARDELNKLEEETIE